MWCTFITKNILSKTILKTIYSALILPHLTYGICTWGFNNCQRIKTIQKRALRIICNQRFNAHTEPLCRNLNVLLFKDIHNFVGLKFTYKIQNNSAPKYFNLFPCLKPDETVQQLRHVSVPRHLSDFDIPVFSLRPLISRPVFNKKLSENCFRFQITKLVNLQIFPRLVLDKAETHSFKGFSDYLKKYILSNYSTVCTIQNCFSCSN